MLAYKRLFRLDYYPISVSVLVNVSRVVGDIGTVRLLLFNNESCLHIGNRIIVFVYCKRCGNLVSAGSSSACGIILNAHTSGESDYLDSVRISVILYGFILKSHTAYVVRSPLYYPTALICYKRVIRNVKSRLVYGNRYAYGIISCIDSRGVSAIDNSDFVKNFRTYTRKVKGRMVCMRLSVVNGRGRNNPAKLSDTKRLLADSPAARNFVRCFLQRHTANYKLVIFSILKRECCLCAIITGKDCFKGGVIRICQVNKLQNSARNTQKLNLLFASVIFDGISVTLIPVNTRYIYLCLGYSPALLTFYGFKGIVLRIFVLK